MPRRDWLFMLTSLNKSRALVIYSILDSIFLFVLDNTIIIDIQSVIGIHFNTISNVIPTNLVWARIYKQFNTKWTYILYITLFEVGSITYSTVPSIVILIIGHAICGLGGSGIYIGTMALLTIITTIYEYPIYLGVLEPIIGGDPHPGISPINRAREIDYIRAALLFGTFVSGFITVSGKILGLFFYSSILFIILGIQQVYITFTTISRYILPIEFFKSRTILILSAMTFTDSTTVFLPIYLVPIFFQFTHNNTALEASICLLPFIFLIIFAIIGNSTILSVYEYYIPWYTLGNILVITRGALIYTIDVDPSVFRVYNLSIIMGFGTGLLTQVLFSIAQTTIETEFITSEVEFITYTQVSGVTIILAIINSIFLNKSQSIIHIILPEISISDIQVTITGTESVLITSLLLYRRRYIIKEVIY
ncbi:hypothetical protein NA56DRAFT_670833 [Hyaloscypha hepaticicola]|uniref:MFS general substrate transporter n=1 Tax=Hyaloscypha hepaticicola TaxID=2082293 RepID=A0A2J6Q4T5_9HELO|nr:hypothetical protein NA56DRAFT_670833 [Hyaloscypha hepaticicola]